MLKIEVLGVSSAMNAVRRDVDRIIDKVADTLLEDAKLFTPIDKGNARRGWKKQKANSKTEIINRVPYIGALERGHSKQAPRGILTPTVQKTIRRYK